MRRPPFTQACSLARALRRLAAAERGSFLVEAMVGAAIMLVVGVGVLKVLDRSAQLGGQQKTQAVAGNVAQSEQELVRALPLAEQSNMRRTSSRTVGGVTYDISSRAQWVNDTSGEASCATAGSKADYMKVSTVVKWPAMGTRRAVTLESLISPGVRAFDASQGSLAVQVSNHLGAGVEGVQLDLSGAATLSNTTSSAGCALWGYLAAGSGYAVAFSKPDYVTPAGSPVGSKPVAVVGDQTSNVAVQYDRGGYLQTTFTTKRTANGVPFATNPRFAHVTNTGGGGVSLVLPVSGAALTTGLLFPFSSAYTVHADTCLAAEVPSPPPTPTPLTPVAPVAATVTVTSGETRPTTPTTVRLPALNVKVTSAGTPVVGVPGVVRVTSACGTVYRRTTIAGGLVDDPGFPYGLNLPICVSDGTRSRQVTQSNTNFNVTSLTVDVRSTDPLGTCP